MNWKTIYIKGNTDFWEEVKRQLEKSSLNCMIGNIEQLPNGTYQGLFWLDDQSDMRDLKEAIGAKLIWDYRLRFFTEEEINQPEDGEQKTRFTDRESHLIQKMRSKFKKKAVA